MLAFRLRFLYADDIMDGVTSRAGSGWTTSNALVSIMPFIVPIQPHLS